jgi:hypothetical protein
MKAIQTVRRVEETEYRGKAKPQYKRGAYMRVYCGSYQDHEFVVKDIRFNHDTNKFEYLYAGILMGGWYDEDSVVPAVGRRSSHYDSQGYCDNPGRGY